MWRKRNTGRQQEEEGEQAEASQGTGVTATGTRHGLLAWASYRGREDLTKLTLSFA